MTDKEVKIKYNLVGSRTYIKKLKDLIFRMLNGQRGIKFDSNIPSKEINRLMIETGYFEKLLNENKLTGKLN